MFVMGVLASGCATFQPKPINPSETSAKLESRSLSDPNLKSFIEKNLGHKLSVWPPRVWNFDMLTLAAMYFNPSIDIYRAKYEAAAAGVQTAKELPNPTLSLIPGYVTNPDGLSPWAPAAALGVPILTAGKIGYRTRAAAALQQSAFFNLLTAAWSVRSQVRLSMLHLFADEMRCRYLSNEVDIPKLILKSTVDRFRSGEVSAQDVRGAESSLYAAQLVYSDAMSRRARDVVRLANVIGITKEKLDSAMAESSNEQPIDFAPFQMLPDTSDVFARKLVRDALTRRPDVLAALSAYNAAESNLQFEIAKQYPDLNIGPGYKWDQGANKWSFGISFTLPIFNQNGGPIAGAEARRKEAEAKFIKIQADALSEIESANAEYGYAFENYSRADSLYNSSSAFVRAETEKLRVGEVDRSQEAEARLLLAQAGLERVSALEAAQDALGQMEDALMTPLRPGEINPATPGTVDTTLKESFLQEK